MTTPRSGSRDGFVLIELLVALSVIAVMAAMMAGVFGQLRSVARLREQVIVKAELEGALSHLERTLSAAKFAKLPENSDNESKVFEGQATQIRFASVTRQGFYSLALRDVDIHIDMQGPAPRLVQTMSLRRAPEVADGTKSTIIILDRFDTIAFSYSDDGLSFVSSFTEDGALPKMVRMTISRAVSGRIVTATGIARIL